MFLSRIRVSPFIQASPELVPRLVEDAYTAHQLVWRAFPSAAGTKRDFVFRQEREKEQLGRIGAVSSMPMFYVVSKRSPTSEDGLFSIDTKSYEPRLEIGHRFSFDLRANPVVSRPIGDGLRSAKHDVLMDAKHRAKRSGVDDATELDRVIEETRGQAVLEWFEHQCDRCGCSLVERGLFDTNGYRQHVLPRRGGSAIRFSSVDITGVVEVTDSERFRTALFSGVGRSKSFGCGLLLIRRW